MLMCASISLSFFVGRSFFEPITFSGFYLQSVVFQLGLEQCSISGISVILNVNIAKDIRWHNLMALNLIKKHTLFPFYTQDWETAKNQVLFVCLLFLFAFSLTPSLPFRGI